MLRGADLTLGVHGNPLSSRGLGGLGGVGGRPSSSSLPGLGVSIPKEMEQKH